LSRLVALGCAVAFAVLAYLFSEVAVVLAMASIGFSFGASVMVAVDVRWPWLVALAGVAVGAVLAAVAVITDLPMILLRVATALGGASAITSGEMLLVGALNTAGFEHRRGERGGRRQRLVVRSVPRDRRRRDPRPGPRIPPGHEPNARRLAIAPDAAILGLMPWVMGTSELRLAAASGSARHPLRWSSVGHACAISDRSIAGAVRWDGEEDVPPRAVIRPTRRNVGRRVYRFIRRPR
jgi:hypothetical protein